MERGKRKQRIGTVVSDRMEKTVVVAVESRYKHPLYKKVLKRIKKFKVHDGQEASKIGDKVRISEVRPLSKTKRWILKEVVRKAE